MNNEALKASDAKAATYAVMPRVTLAGMEAKIASVHYVIAGDVVLGDIEGQHRDPHPLDVLTLCFVTMKNGFTVTGKSACASPENFNAEYGQELAYGDAINQLWSHEAYLLRETQGESPIV